MPALVLLVALTFTPAQVPSVHLIEAETTTRPSLSTGRLLSAPFVGLFGELIGAQLALLTVQPILTPAADLLPHHALVGLSIGFAALSSIVLAAASIVLIQPFLEQH